ncbi:MAG: hypothetical protein R2849_23700 [Thermomicrobiales bacterium]
MIFSQPVDVVLEQNARCGDDPCWRIAPPVSAGTPAHAPVDELGASGQNSADRTAQPLVRQIQVESKPWA